MRNIQKKTLIFTIGTFLVFSMIAMGNSTIIPVSAAQYAYSPDAYEENNSFETSTLITPGEHAWLSISDTLDEHDYFNI